VFLIKLKTINSLYKNKDIHKFMWEARGNKSIIDYRITNDRLISNIQDARALKEVNLIATTT